MGCRANYLIFKDLDRKGVSFFTRDLGKKRMTQAQIKPRGRQAKKRDTSCKESQYWLARSPTGRKKSGGIHFGKGSPRLVFEAS